MSINVNGRFIVIVARFLQRENLSMIMDREGILVREDQVKTQRGKKEHIETKEPNKSALKHNRRIINIVF